MRDDQFCNEKFIKRLIFKLKQATQENTKYMSEQNKSTGKFFSISVSVIDEIVQRGGSVEAAICMIVLCRGAGIFDSTAWAANSIRKNVEMPLIRAKEACEWLEKEKFISINVDIDKVDNISLNAPSIENKAAQGRKNNFEKRWNISKGKDKDKLIYLPNALIDGTEKSTTAPIQNLYNDIIVHYAEGQVINDARFDALMLLIHLYSEHSLEAYGGVNPNVWYRRWNPNDLMMEGVARKDIDGSPASLYEIQRGDFVVGDKFISSTLFYAAEGVRKQRFLWASFRLSLYL